jgi:predicted NAD/FAD-binding protein
MIRPKNRHVANATSNGARRMPFENAQPPRRIAIVGGGISGLGAAWQLAGSADVTLFEAAPRLGGHARTRIAGRRGDQPVDTGFIVFNHANYPNLTRMFGELDVPVAKSDMSFAASIGQGRLEYAIRDLNGLFAQRRNLVRPGFLGMLRDILRFNRMARSMAQDPDMTVADMFKALRLGRWFRDYYFLPFSGAIWSTPLQQMLDFPAQALVRFFDNHALLAATGQHQWYTVRGGSIEYVRRLEAWLTARGVALRPATPVQAIRRNPDSVAVKPATGPVETFDEVILATHSDIALRLLADPAPAETAALGAIRYQPNRVVLHCDPGQMPINRRAWASWNYRDAGQGPEVDIPMTYWMNALQPIPKDDPLFVTLNPFAPIPEHCIHDETVLHHPVYDRPALAAQGRVWAMQGDNRTWFAGAWLRDGFHEDGLWSAVEVATAIRSRVLR